MDSYLEKYSSILKLHNFSLTSPRRVVFEALYSYGLQSMNQLVSRCGSVNRASVYRSVVMLEQLDIIIRVPQGFKYKIELSDIFLPHHHHITCSICGRHSDIEQTRLEQLLSEIANGEGYSLTSHKVELLGICPICK